MRTGHAFGLSIRLLYDATAVGILLFVLTGVHLWWTPRRQKRRKERKASAGAVPAEPAAIVR